jgi:hypothetical protein
MNAKLKPAFAILTCLAIFGSCRKPPEAPPGADTHGPTVYVLGADSNHNFAYWKNGVAASMPATITGAGGYVSGKNVYAAGASSFYVGPDQPATPEYWNNGAVTHLPAATGAASAAAIFASGSDVYVAGTTYYPQQLTVPYTTPTASYPTAGYVATYWKNGVAATLPSLGIIGGAAGFYMTNYADYISGIFVSGNDVYVSGGSNISQQGVDSSYRFARYWKNGVATELVNGLVTTTPTHSSYPNTSGIYVSGNDIYVAGVEMDSDPQVINSLTLRAMYWKNGVANYLTNFQESTAAAASIFVSGSDVYVAGYETLNNYTYATYWKNGVATNLTSNVFSEASSIFVSGSDVYVAGFEVLNGIKYAVYWKNGTAVKLGANYTATSIYVE